MLGRKGTWSDNVAETGYLGLEVVNNDQSVHTVSNELFLSHLLPPPHRVP